MENFAVPFVMLVVALNMQAVELRKLWLATNEQNDSVQLQLFIWNNTNRQLKAVAEGLAKLASVSCLIITLWLEASGSAAGLACFGLAGLMASLRVCLYASSSAKKRENMLNDYWRYVENAAASWAANFAVVTAGAVMLVFVY